MSLLCMQVFDDFLLYNFDDFDYKWSRHKIFLLQKLHRCLCSLYAIMYQELASMDERELIGAGHCRRNLKRKHNPIRRGNESVTGIVSLNTLVIHVRQNSNLFIVLLDLFIVTDFFLCMVNGFCVLTC
jgi:hypothetical protein